MAKERKDYAALLQNVFLPGELISRPIKIAYEFQLLIA
jgi:hypothetical protein